jgi:hypothetical protein
MTQRLLFHPVNNGPVKVFETERTSILKMAKIFGKSVSTIERCLKNSSEISDELKTKVQEFAKNNNFEFTNQKRYEAIKPEFLTGKKDRYGIPQVNEALICQMRRDRMSIENIKRATGIQVGRIAKILKSSGLPTHSLNTKFDEKGLSERQSKAIERHERRMRRLGLKQKNSTIRKKIAAILIEYKKNYTPIEKQIIDLCIPKWTVWKYLKNSFTYKVLKSKNNRKYAGVKDSWEENKKSRKYRYEKHMYPDVRSYLASIFPNSKIEQEACVLKTSTRGRMGFTADFLVKEKNLCIEVKQRTTTSSNKSLYGQIFVFQSKGYQCAALFPSDVVIPNDLSETLTSNGVQIMVLPCP